MNNAATSFPKVPGLGKEVGAFLEKIPRHPGRSGANQDNILNLCRREIAALIKVENPADIVLCKNSTEAFNIVFHGLELNGAAVVTTAMEHNSVLRPLYLLQKTGAIKLEIITCDREGRIHELEWKKKIGACSPKLVVLNHASNVTGAVNNVEELLNYAKNRGCITVLDASQSLGLREINPSRIGADIVVFTGHKYLLGPCGSGGFYVNKEVKLEPVFVGGTGVRSDLKTMPPEMPIKLEPGTPNIPVFAGLLYSLIWQKKNPVSQGVMKSLTKKMEQGLEEKGARVVKVTGDRTFMVSFILPGQDLNDVGFVLERSFEIVCRTGLHCAPLIHDYIGTAPEGCIRFSLSRFTTEEEVAYSVKVVGELMHGTH